MLNQNKHSEKKQDTMNFFLKFKREILEALNQLVVEGVLPSGLDFSKVTVDPPKESKFGDISTNAAMIVAKPAEKKPQDIARLLLPKLKAIEGVEDAEIAGPGFINLFLKNQVWYAHLEQLLRIGKAYGQSTIGQGKRINLEYVSVNPTGPMHAGHGRVAIVADALANLLEKIGCNVVREFYINDAGGQAAKLANSLYLRYREALGEEIGVIPEGYYPGEYLKPIGEEIAAQDGSKWLNAGESERIEYFRNYAVLSMMKRIRADLEALGIYHEVFSSEMELQKQGIIEKTVATLEDRGLIYTGVLEAPKGKVIEDWEPRPQLLFRSTQFGDDVDRPLKKSDGSWTYFAGDIAYHYDKFNRGFSHMIDVWGADHGGYVKRIKAAVEAITEGKAQLDISLCQIVNFFENGQPLRMSKRAGNFIEIRDVLEKVGKDVFRFMLLSRKNDAHLDFDFLKAIEQSRENPVFYVNYAYARCHSVKKIAEKTFPSSSFADLHLNVTELTSLQDEDELKLIKMLTGWPRQIENAAEAQEPHRLCYYLYDIASQFHLLWNKGKEDTYLRFVVANDLAVTRARLALIQAVIIVIASGLEIFGVTPMEEMRE